MKITEFKTYQKEITLDVLCDVCAASCAKFSRDQKLLSVEISKLTAEWGYYSDSDGKSYSIDLCEDCFYDTLAHLKYRCTTDGKNLNSKEYY